MRVHYLSHPVSTGGRPIEQNRLRAAAIAAKLQLLYPNEYVINPANTIVERWLEEDYNVLWRNVIKHIGDTQGIVFFANDWHTSVGCKLEHNWVLNYGIEFKILGKNYEDNNE